MKFYLGTHMPGWLATLSVPLFVSRRRLTGRTTLPRARAPWALDSGGFTELSMHGSWQVSARDYAGEVQRFARDIGSLDWAAPQDWMCEPHVLRKTGLSVREHQARTIASVAELRAMGAPVIPVLQGWTLDDYLRHVDDYVRADYDLTSEPIVGVGTICRRQSTQEAARILRALSRLGLRLHAFGAKVSGLRLYRDRVASADSMAWSFSARARKLRLPGCEHLNCGNCPKWAMEWRRQVLLGIEAGEAPLVSLMEAA